jgi:hypothetical protein
MMLLPDEVEREVTFCSRRATVRRYRLSPVYERDTSMGLFYSNFTLYGPDHQKVVDAVRRMRRMAYVSPTVSRFTTVYDREAEHQVFDVIELVGRELSLDLECPVMGVVLHDDDVLYYWLFRNGDVRHAYNSSPAYFDPDSEPLPPEGGDADELCECRRAYEPLRLSKWVNDSIFDHLTHCRKVPLTIVRANYSSTVAPRGADARGISSALYGSVPELLLAPLRMSVVRRFEGSGVPPPSRVPPRDRDITGG